ncbi:von willebrand factor type A domain protein (macronuclear) [Tetrahymena thermophila SB210]|uniref:von willebrand factor type A domain protein n=1 Tax=Tetrahymena thermophila (strain SB210) TaxID=312017 RepID=Q23KK4_TETTS|nr:von willebrand factor type A domain protein [Tetrahymena thermophila SB210]EAR96839.1 von willebrand factor type A domain protein [Tetrahymena thermophila SB210]|eukprot:XP_001017084.1 von willebrand factor type A domain protein [Tetrahymena thermophila SB210]
MDFDKLSEEDQTNSGVVAPNLNDTASTIPSQSTEPQHQALHDGGIGGIQQPLNAKVSQATSQVGDIAQGDTQKTPSSSQQQNSDPNNLKNEQENKQENSEKAKLEPSQLVVQIQNNQNQQQTQIMRHGELTIQNQLEVQSVISAIVNKYDKFSVYQDQLNTILKFSPKPSATDEDQDSQKKYVENVKKLKQIVCNLLDFPLQYNKLQNSFTDTTKDFNKIHSHLCSHINNLIKLTYNINQDNLGSNYKQLEVIQQKLDACKSDGENLQQTLYKLEKVNDSILEHFSTFFGQQMSDSQDNLFSLKEDLKKEIQKRDKEQYDASQKFQEASLLITQKNSMISTHQTRQKLLNSDIQQIESKIKKLEADKNKQVEDLEARKDKYLKQLEEEKAKLIREKSAFWDKKNSSQEARLSQYSQSINSLNSKYPLGKMCSIVEKKYFHYYFIQDESGSFSNDHQYAIQGVAQLFNRIKPNDYITYIKFDSSSHVDIPKTLKSSLSQGDFISKIQKCRGGGTNFQSAFQTLLQQIQSKYDQQEYPVVIFITDGQDNTDLDSIISQITSLCQDIVFYTIGYGSVNEKYLKNITNKFNNTVGEKKEINGKPVDLFYVKNTPNDLVQSLSSISQQQSSISIEDIKKAQQFLKESFEQMTKTAEEYYSKTEDSYDKKIGLITSQIYELQNKDISSAQQLTESVQKDILKQNQLKNQQIEQVSNENTQIENLRQEIRCAKQTFLRNIGQQDTGKIDDTDIEEELNKNLKLIQDKYQKEIHAIEEKIKNAIKKIEEDQQKQENTIIGFGFQNYPHFKKFNDSQNAVKEAQIYYINLIQDLMSLVKQLQFQNNSFNEAIENSQTYLEESNKFDNQYHVFTQFKQIDETIDPEDSFNSTKKVIFIINNSIQQKCQDDKELLAFYDHVIRSIRFNYIIQNYVDKKKEEQAQYIKNEVIPDIIKTVPKQLSKLETRKKGFDLKISKKEKEIRNLRSDLKDEVDSQKKKEIQEEIKTCEEVLKELNKDLNELLTELEELQSEFETENLEKINIIKDVVFALIQAVTFALFKKKFQMAQAPFYQLLNGGQSFIKALSQYQPLAISN